MAYREFAMPDLGEGLTESELVSWMVAEGDSVELNQVIAEVETAKALVQLPSPYAGTVSRLLVEPGTTVRVGSTIVAFDTAEAAPPAAGEPDVTPAAEDEATAADTAAPETADGASAGGRTSVLVGYGPPIDSDAKPARKRRRQHEPDASAEPPAAPQAPAPATAEARPADSAPAERPRSTPPVRKLAADLGVDLTGITGTGPDGLITRDDVTTAVTAAGNTGQGPRAGASGARERRTPIAGVRKHTAKAMVTSAFTAPQASVFLTVDVTPSLELLESIAADRAFAGRKVTILTVVAKAVAIAIRRTPAMNSFWDEAAGEIVEFDYVNLGIAAATPRGLVVPNIPDADSLDLMGLADAISELATTARSGATPAERLRGGTITLTNVGVFGVDTGTAILNPGEAAIVALGAIRRQPWEHRGEIALRSVMTLSVTFDHRLVDGEQAARFLADVGAMLASPGATLTMV